MSKGDIGRIERSPIARYRQRFVMSIAAMADRPPGDDIGDAGASVIEDAHAWAP